MHPVQSSSMKLILCAPEEDLNPNMKLHVV